MRRIVFGKRKQEGGGGFGGRGMWNVWVTIKKKGPFIVIGI
jgi:hypothetical protein